MKNNHQTVAKLCCVDIMVLTFCSKCHKGSQKAWGLKECSRTSSRNATNMEDVAGNQESGSETYRGPRSRRRRGWRTFYGETSGTVCRKYKVCCQSGTRAFLF
jgi:hypothetical protein